MFTVNAGTLYVVATPIGNLGDLTPRARDVLASVDLIAAEDTRRTRQLLQTCGVGTALTSLYEHNEAQKSGELVARLAQGQSIALVCDAGTPLVSDPGFELVAAAKKQGIAVIAIPGACAAVAALSIAGLPTDRFAFEGFLPAKAPARIARLERLAGEERTMIFYEAPHRLAQALRDMAQVLGAGRLASVSRELTKRFETTYSATLAQLSESAERDSDMARGEIVIVVSGGTPAASGAVEMNADAVLRALLDELPPSQAAKIAARLTGGKRSELYEAALRLGGGKGVE